MLAGYDENADGDLGDANDNLLVSETFASGTASFTYCNAGNLVQDEKFTYTYDAPALDSPPSAKGARRHGGKWLISCSMALRRVRPFLKERSLCRA